MIAAGDAVFLTVSAGFGVTVRVAVDSGEVTLTPAGVLPVASAVLVTEPASTSACVAEYVAVQVTLAPGASGVMPAGQLMADRMPVPENDSSLTEAPVIVTLPLLVTLNE